MTSAAAGNKLRVRREMSRQFNLAVLRLADLNKLFRHRYGHGDLFELPDDDSGRHDLQLLLHHHACLHGNIVRMRSIIAARAPWMESDEAAEIINDTCRGPRRWTALELGQELALAEPDRRRLGIRTIASIDMSPEQRRLEKRLRDRRRQRKCRKAKGARMRTEYEAGASIEPSHG
jgi:hypothetical protein